MSKPKKRKPKAEATQPLRGPRGGTSTMTRSGMTKKNLWVHLDLAEALRRRAFEERRSEADIIREGLRLMLRDWMLVVALLLLT